ncbi:MAG TPA: preprotein translocase subunit SecG [Candidatus Eisenbacteria bacterium]|jgi:preprotein translocase subunit SecG
MSGILQAFIIGVHVLVCAALMVAILLQSGKGGGLAGAFGAGSSQTLFGGRGAATFLSRTTTVLAAVFFLTSLTLGLSASRSGRAGGSVVAEEAKRRAQERAAQQGAGAPTTPLTPAPAPSGGASGQAPATSPTGPAPKAPAPSGATGK